MRLLLTNYIIAMVMEMTKNGWYIDPGQLYDIEANSLRKTECFIPLRLPGYALVPSWLSLAFKMSM